MTSPYQKYLRICLAAGGISLLLGGLLFAALNQPETSAVNDECIRCHVAVYNQGIEKRNLHAPFWEKNCVACHLEEGTTWSVASSESATATITGTLVSQVDLWRKVQIFPGTMIPVFDQLISIPVLKMSTAYRLRIVVSPQKIDNGGELHKSLWLGLLLKEIDGGPLDLSIGLSTSVASFAKNASLSRNGSSVFISWQTSQPLYGWVELEELEGLNLTELTPDTIGSSELSKNQNQHPPLRDPERLAINVCYQCHPESTLGTSHPVRLYGGQDVIIPDDLPTVDGMLTCVTCHDPHGSAGKMLVRETIKTKLCVACHYKYKNSSPSTMFD